MLSPLPFTPFEELMLYQDSRAYPCNCFIRLKLRGRPHKEALEEAFQTALQRHPLLTARVEFRRRSPWWIWDECPSPTSEWHECEHDAELDSATTHRRLDLETGPGIRLVVVSGRSVSHLDIHFHHACCDGLGIFQFIHDLLVLYDRQCNPAAGGTRLPVVDPDLLRNRGKFGLTKGKLLRMLPKQAVGLLGVRQFLMREPVAIIPHERFPATAPEPTPYPAVVSWQSCPKTAKCIRQAATNSGTTTNDLLARDLFLALSDFRGERDVEAEQHWLRMMVPVNLRTATDRAMPAANVVSSVFLDRRLADFRDANQLLNGIHEEMELIKRNQLGFTFVFSLSAFRRFPGGLRRSARGQRCESSVVFTNLGKLLGRAPLARDDGRLICGDIVLDHIEILAPLAPYTCVAFAAGWYADRLTITLHYDPRILTTADSQQLLSAYVARIQQTADRDVATNDSSSHVVNSLSAS